jgi:hypothetical protein
MSTSWQFGSVYGSARVRLARRAKTKNAANPWGCGVFAEVEARGLEPLTSSMLSVGEKLRVVLDNSSVTRGQPPSGAAEAFRTAA